jgi:hypothetical protein
MSYVGVSLTQLFAYKTIGVFFHWAFFFLFLYLRIRGDKEPLTLSQRWAMTALIWLFLLNSITISMEFYLERLDSLGVMLEAYFLRRISSNIDILIGFSLLMFGLVYPRPYTSWNKLQLILIGLMIMSFIGIGIQIMGHASNDPDVKAQTGISAYTYTIGWFIPVLIWLSQYEKETSPHSRMVLTLFMWGFIATAMSHGVPNFLRLFNPVIPFNAHSLMSVMFIVYVTVKLTLILWSTRRNWDLTHRIHLVFLSFIIFSGVLRVIGSTDPLSNFIYVMTENASWTIMRPALISYAILRYQIFGPKLKVERPLVMIITTICCLVLLAIVQFMPVDVPDITLVGAGIVLAIVVFIPLLRVSRGLVVRFLPMTRGEGAIPMREKRAIYLISLQTSIVKGRIDNEWDRARLEEQRRALGISKREHDLLMDSFAMREGLAQKKEVVDELFLVHIDGRLLAHVARKVEGGPKGKDSDIVAGMLVAIRDYVSEGLRSGRGATALDSVKYGDYSLIIETEGKAVLAAVVKGPGSPELRQHLQDQLKLINKRHGKRIEDWDGNRDKVEGARLSLEGFMEEIDIL